MEHGAVGSLSTGNHPMPNGGGGSHQTRSMRVESYDTAGRSAREQEMSEVHASG